MAGKIIVSTLQSDTDNSISFVANTGATIFSANLSNGIAGSFIANSSITGDKIASSATLTTPIISGNLNLDSTGTTGVRSPSANTLVFYEGGVEAMRIDSSGNLGIGTTSPNGYGAGFVTVQSNGSTGGLIQASYGTTTAIAEILMTSSEGRFGTRTNHPMILKTNNTEQARITEAGLMQFNSGYGSVATAYGVRAWISYKGTATRAINASGNISSVTYNGTGDYTINFSTALADANYAVAGGPLEGAGTAINAIITYTSGGYTTAPALKSNTQYRFVTSNNGTVSDAFSISLAFIR